MKECSINSEKDLITLLKNGSYDAFDAIYSMYARRLYAYCLQYTKSVADSEDIVQEVFTNLWNKRSTIRQEESIRGLLFTMAKYKLINAYRSRVNKPLIEEYINTLAATDKQPHLEYIDFLKRFKRLLSKLPPTQKRVIVLSRLRNMTNKEISEELSLSEQTVKNQLSLGIKALKEKLTKNLLLFALFMISK